jgi:outer membrane protein TolC
MRRQIRALAALALTLLMARPGLAQNQPVPAPAPDQPATDRPTLELTLDDAVKRALENNADVAVSKYNPEFAAEDVRSAQGYYDPYLSSTLSKTSSDTPATNAFTGGEKVNNKTWLWNFGLTQAIPTGAVVNVLFNNNKQDTNSVFTTFNPTYNSNLAASISQPLLKNFRLDTPRYLLKVAKKNREISDVQFREIVVNILATTKQQYYNLIAALDNLEAQRKSLALAQKLLDENQIKVKVGTMAPLDVVQAQSEVASREADVIVAENTVVNAEDTLKRSIFPANDPATWALQIVPRDRPTAEPYPVDEATAIKNALQSRTDIVQARLQLERADYGIQYTKSQLLPQLDFIGSYGAAGVGGTQLIRDGFGGPVIDTIPGGYGDALSSVFGNDFPTWRVGVQLSYPILNRQAKAAAAQARITKDQQLASYRRLELQVATEVRNAARAVETNFKRVDATKAARVLQEQRLDAEEKKFAAGMSTNFFVTQAQRDLALAEVNEVQAIADYRKSIVSFQLSQEAGFAGSQGAALSTLSAVSSARTPSSGQTGANQAQQ